MGSMTSPRIPAAQYVPPHAKFLRSTVMAKVLHTQHGINTRSRYPAQCQDDVIMSITILSRSLDAHEDTAMHYLIRSRTTARHIHAQRNNDGRFFMRSTISSRAFDAQHEVNSHSCVHIANFATVSMQNSYQRARLKCAPLGECKVVVSLAKGMWAQHERCDASPRIWDTCLAWRACRPLWRIQWPRLLYRAPFFVPS